MGKWGAMATPGNDKLQEFKSESLRLASRVPALGDMFKVSGSNELQSQRELGLKSRSIDGANASGALAATQIAERHQHQELQRRASNDTTMFLQMLQLIRDQIGALDAQIAKYDEQIAATDSLIDIFENGGEIDPTNPEHQRLLRLAGIPEDQWGTVTLDDLNRHRDDLNAKRDDAKADRDDKARSLDKLEQAEEGLVKNGSVHASTLDMDEAVAIYAMLDPDFDPAFVTAHQVVQIAAIHTADAALDNDNYQEMELAWFKAEYSTLSLGGLSNEAVAQYIGESLIERLNIRAKDELLLDSSIDVSMRELIALDRLEMILDGSSATDLDAFKKMALEGLPLEVRQLLFHSDKVDSDLKEFLGEDLEAPSSELGYNAQ